MSSPAWMPFYVDDYLGDTGDLSTLEHGAYMLLILHYWKHRGLPDDNTRLARIARLQDAEWATMRDAIAVHFLDGWKHNRIEDELAKADDTIIKRKAAGVAGAFARYGKGTGKRMPEAMPTQQQTDAPSPPPMKVAAQPSASAAISEKLPAIPIIPWRGDRTPEWFDQIEAESREAAGLENEPSPALCDTSPIVTLIDQGFDFARDILPKLRAAKAAKKRGRTWAYYVAAIVEGKAANGRIAPKLTPTGKAPDVWITDEDPQWPTLAERWREARGKPPPVLAGSHGNTGRGWHFPAEMISTPNPIQS